MACLTLCIKNVVLKTYLFVKKRLTKKYQFGNNIISNFKEQLLQYKMKYAEAKLRQEYVQAKNCER